MTSAANGFRRFWPAFAGLLFLIFSTLAASAQEKPYFVTYDHQMEDSGDLEVATESTIGLPHAPTPGYFAPILEFEYGVTPWWTSELYLEGQSTRRDSTIFTGWRLENRFRLLQREHFINPVVYFEYENVNEASRIQKEIVGHFDRSRESNAELRQEHAHEIEAKLILSSQTHGWNVSENFIVEKNLTEEEGYEFGYALGVYRPLASGESLPPVPRKLCRRIGNVRWLGQHAAVRAPADSPLSCPYRALDVRRRFCDTAFARLRPDPE